MDQGPEKNNSHTNYRTDGYHGYHGHPSIDACIALPFSDCRPDHYHITWFYWTLSAAWWASDKLPSSPHHIYGTCVWWWTTYLHMQLELMHLAPLDIAFCGSDSWDRSLGLPRGVCKVVKVKAAQTMTVEDSRIWRDPRTWSTWCIHSGIIVWVRCWWLVDLPPLSNKRTDR